METQKIGGVPCDGFYFLRKFLPVDKKSRHQVVTVITMVLTYVTFMAFITTRMPLILIEMLVMQECKIIVGNITDPDPWCRNFAFMGDPHLTLAYLSTISFGSYAGFLHFSGCFALDYFNPRYYLSLGCLFGSCFYFLYSLTTLWGVKSMDFLVAVIILEEMAHCTVWPILLSCCTYWYAGSRMGAVFGLWNSQVVVGRLVGIFMIYHCLITNWAFAFVIPGSFLGVMTIFVFTLLVAHPTDLNKLYTTQSSCIETEDEDGPSWLDSWRSLDYWDAFRVPGVLQFCACMFFGRIADYCCCFWLPKLERESVPSKNGGVLETDPTTLASIPYALGGVVGGMVCGVLKDIYNKATLTCMCFYMASLPVTALHMLESNMSQVTRFCFNFILGVFVQGPYILLKTSISYDLSRSPLVRRGHRGIATVAAIIESAGASGAAITPFVHYFVTSHHVKRGSVFQIIMLVEIAAGLSLVRMACTDYSSRRKQVVPFKKYFMDLIWERRRSSV